MKTKCKECGIEFTPCHKSRKYCGDKCYQRHYYQLNYKSLLKNSKTKDKKQSDLIEPCEVPHYIIDEVENYVEELPLKRKKQSSSDEFEPRYTYEDFERGL